MQKNDDVWTLSDMQKALSDDYDRWLKRAFDKYCVKKMAGKPKKRKHKNQ